VRSTWVGWRREQGELCWNERGGGDFG
jgi:hypothetical protein